MKQTKYNYHGTPQGSHMSYRAEIERLKNTPTVKQKRYYASLIRELKKHGVDPFKDTESRPFTRAMYADEIDRLIKLCGAHNIQIYNTKSDGINFERVLVVNEDHFRDGDLRISDQIVRPASNELTQSSKREMKPVAMIEIYKIELLLMGQKCAKIHSLPKKEKERILAEYPLTYDKVGKKYQAYIDDIWSILASKFPERTSEYKNFTVCLYAIKYGATPCEWVPNNR